MSEIQIVAALIAGEWAATHGTVAGPREASLVEHVLGEASLVEHVLTELGETSLDDLYRRWAPS